jgi:hypothetical protein
MLWSLSSFTPAARELEERKREQRKGGRKKEGTVCAQIYVCVCERERERNQEKEENARRGKGDRKNRKRECVCEREREREIRRKKRMQEGEKETERTGRGSVCVCVCVCVGEGKEEGFFCPGVPWFGNSRGAAILDCGEVASGSSLLKTQKADPCQAIIRASLVALTHSGLSTPRNTKFTQAQNVALLRPHSLIATIVFALHPQASRAIKKVVHCHHGLPFTVGDWSPSRPVSPLRRHK